MQHMMGHGRHHFLDLPFEFAAMCLFFVFGFCVCWLLHGLLLGAWLGDSGPGSLLGFGFARSLISALIEL